jgi:hypothetical protein
MEKLGWHFDFHSHKSVRIGHAPDFAAAAAALKGAGVDEVITFAKCHNGFSYYPTRVGTPHPRMKTDVLGGMVKACHKGGIRAFAYVSFGIDGEAARKHPEWAQWREDKKPEISPDWFVSVCPFTGYTEELMLPQIDEIIRMYRPDGLWFDTMGALGVCYCKDCKEAFRGTHNTEIPNAPDDPNWAVYGAFRRKRGIALLDRIGRFIRTRLPNGVVGFNQIGSAPYPEKMPASITRLTLDPPCGGHQSLAMGFCAAYGANADRPAEVMPTIMNQGWGDWSLATPARFEKVAAAAWARKVRLFMGDRLHPEGRLDQATLHALRSMDAIRRHISAEFPPDDSKADDEVVLLNSRSLAYGEDVRYFARAGQDRLAPLKGAHRLLLDAGASMTVVGEDFLSSTLDRAGLVVLPELPGINFEANAALKAFLKKGGKVLVVGQVPHANGKPVDWIGVSRDEKPWQDHIWLPAWPQISHDMPVLVRGDFHKLTLKGAKAMAVAIQPYDLAHGVRFGWGIGPASDKPSRFPALTRNRVGKGEVWYLEAPIFSSYAAGINWQQVEWISALLEKILPEPRARLRASAGNVELVSRRTQGATWAVLINHGGEEHVYGLSAWPRVLTPLPAYSVRLELRDERAPQRVAVNGADWRFERRGKVLAVDVTMDGIWKVVRVDWM